MSIINFLSEKHGLFMSFGRFGKSGSKWRELISVCDVIMENNGLNILVIKNEIFQKAIQTPK